MSTRANVIITDGEKELIFYRHSDGYPEGVRDSLEIFLSLLRDGKIRDNVNQSAGWLILIGNREYGTYHPVDLLINYNPENYTEIGDCWKCGAYEPSFWIDSDIEFLYKINVIEKSVKAFRAVYNSLKDDLEFEEIVNPFPQTN